jgi:HlyD family secretion protein
MKKALKVAFTVVVVGGVGYALAAAARTGRDKEPTITLVKVARGTLVDKALATGQIVPEQEIQVKSQISGIVKECTKEVGDQVRAGEPLFTITPDPTPMELNDTQRKVQLAEVAFAQAKADFARNKSLYEEGILSRDLFDASQKSFDEARIQLDMAKERLALTRDGRIERSHGVGGVDSVIRAPASGTVLQRQVNPGDPVVPLTTYQAGTPLMTMADMGTLLFKGTVDEIDVGKLREGMPVRIKVGALPDAVVTGTLTRIAPKATEKDGTTLFDVEASIKDGARVVLRAGYSANADIIIQEKKDVPVLPERLVTFEKEKAFVEVPGATPEAEPVRREVAVGLSDGLNVEIVSGLAEGEQVVQRPPKEITGS